jgi:hypothetical protein
MRINTEGWEGDIHKSARVYTNDPVRGVQIIRIKAVIKTPIHMSTPYIYFQGLSDSPITRSVEIRAEEDKDLELKPVAFDLRDKVTYDLVELEPGRLFRVELSTIPGIHGTYMGKLELSTNYQAKPLLTISIRGRIKQAEGSAAQSP